MVTKYQAILENKLPTVILVTDDVLKVIKNDADLVESN